MLRKNIHLIFIACLLCFLSGCTKVWHVADSEYATNRLDSVAVFSEELQQMIQPYKVELDNEMNTIVASCPEDMPKKSPESTLGNWMADVIYDRANELSEVPIDFAMQNSGGIRIPLLRKGDITKGKLYELMPFENSLIVVHLDKELLMTFLNRVAKSGGWPVSKNFYMKLKNNEVEEVKISGEPLTDRTYHVALPDYIANGGSDCPFLKGCKRTVYPDLLREMFIERAIADKVIAAKVEGRIVR